MIECEKAVLSSQFLVASEHQVMARGCGWAAGLFELQLSELRLSELRLSELRLSEL